MKCRNCYREVIPEKVNGYIHLDGTVACGPDFGDARAELDTRAGEDIVRDETAEAGRYWTAEAEQADRFMPLDDWSWDVDPDQPIG